MYLGYSEQKLVRPYLDPALRTTVYDMRHVYKCEACGRLSLQVGKAEEPFYCGCERNALIGVTPADPDQLYDACCEAVATGNADDACDAAQALRTWAFSDDAKAYDRGTITKLIGYCDLVVLNHGHKCRPLGV